MGGVQRLAKELSSLHPSIASPEHGAEVGKSARSFEPRVRALERADRLPEQRRAPVAARHEPGGSLRDSEGARGAVRPCKLELLGREALGGLVLRERKVGESGFRSPREVARDT